MAEISQKPDLPSNTPRGPDRPGVPIRGTSHNYVNAQLESQNSPTSPTVVIPDGRRNSRGQAIQSPTETWKPNFGRKQSWNQEDLKRELMMSGIDKPKESTAAGLGFTERQDTITEGEKKV